MMSTWSLLLSGLLLLSSQIYVYIPVLKNIWSGIITMVSRRLFSKMCLLTSLSPCVASPLLSGEPLKSIAILEPPSSVGFIFSIIVSKKSNAPSLLGIDPLSCPTFPHEYRDVPNLSTSSLYSLQSTPNGGFEII